MIDGVAGWDDSSNNKAFAARLDRHDDERHQHLVRRQERTPPTSSPTSPTRRRRWARSRQHTVSNNFTSAFVFKYSKYPNAAKEYLRFMLDTPQADRWVTEMLGYVTPALKKYAELADLDVEPEHHAVPRRARRARSTTVTTASPAKPRPRRSTSSSIVDMFADVCVNKMAPKDAMRKAESQAGRRSTSARDARSPLLARLDSPRVLGYLLITPAAIILLGLLAYPLLLGIWLSLTSATIGKPGEFVGLQNYATIFADPIFRGAALFSVFYTVCAEVGKARARPRAGAAAQPAFPRLPRVARADAAAVGRADGALRARVAVAARPAVQRGELAARSSCT